MSWATLIAFKPGLTHVMLTALMLAIIVSREGEERGDGIEACPGATRLTSARAFSSYELVFNNVAKTTYFLPAMGLLGRPPRGGAPGGLGTSGGAPDGGTGFRAGFVVGPPMTRRSTLALVSSPKSTPSPFASSESVAAIDLSFPTRPFTEGWSNIRSTLTMCSARSFLPPTPP